MGDVTRWRLLLVAAILGLGLSSRTWAGPDDPPPSDAAEVGKAPVPPSTEPQDFGDSIKPLPLAPIPDDPPPHEGAMFELPYVIEAPDILLVEVLEALPGRPISGERLVRPDGKISLGFYGDVHVQGLTLPQAKEKVVLHLRKILPDEVLGLYEYASDEPMKSLPGDNRRPREEENGKAEGSPKKTSRRPAENRGKVASRPGLARIRRTGQATYERPKPLKAPPSESMPSRTTPPEGASGENVTRVDIPGAGGGPPITIQINVGTHPGQASQPTEPQVMDPAPEQGPTSTEGMVLVDPEASNRVFVDVTQFNSKNYYIQGDVAKPGKLPWTGHETVLDALNYAGGLTTTANPKDVRLARPARAGKPSRVYRVDLEAITELGENEKNYQLFPGDRLIVGRIPLVKTTIEVDRLAAPLQTIFNSIIHQTNAIRSLMQASMNANPSPTPEQRDAIVRESADFWWKILSRTEGVTLDEQTFRDSLFRAFNPPANDRPSEKK